MPAPITPGLASALRTDDPALAQEAFHHSRWLREEKDLNAFQEIGMSIASAAELTDRYDKAEVDLELMIREEDRVGYDLEGLA